MIETNIGTPEFLTFHSQRLRQLLGADWLETELSIPDVQVHQHPLWIVDGYRLLPEWIESVRTGRAPADVHVMLRFGWAAHTISAAVRFPGGDTFAKALRDSVHAMRSEQFEDTMFEAETAVFWAQSMGVKHISFGPPAGHPDILAEAEFGASKVAIPIECKRIRATSPEQQELEEFLSALDEELQAVMEECPLKVIVWLHRRIKPGDVNLVAGRVVDLLDRLTRQEVAADWITTAPDTGEYQISIAPLGLAAEWQWPGPHITDVPADRAVAVRAETIHGEKKARVKSVLSIRSDRVVNRIGNLRGRVEEAIQQLRRSTTDTSSGAISVRIRPPRGQGDIFESDVIVRRALRNKNADHVGLVLLHWSESDRAEGAEQVLEHGSSAREVRQDLTLKFYAIAGPNRRIDFSTIDSRSSRFPEEPSALIRDPNSGELLPISRSELIRILDGSDVTEEQVLDADGDGNTPDEGAATVYLQPEAQLWANPTDLVSSVISVGQRQFRTVLLSDLHCRTVEIREGQIVNVATIDLRAWVGAFELLYRVRWQADDFLVEFLMADEVTTVRASSCRVRNLPGSLSTDDVRA